MPSREEKVFGYALALLPIIGAHICIPPVSYLKGKENPPAALDALFLVVYDLVKEVNPGLMSYNYVMQLLFNSTVLKSDGNEYRLLTYMFVHADYTHLLNNLASAINLGFPIYEEVSPCIIHSPWKSFGSHLLVCLHLDSLECMDCTLYFCSEEQGRFSHLHYMIYRAALSHEISPRLYRCPTSTPCRFLDA